MLCCIQSLSHVQAVILWTVARNTTLSVEFFRQEFFRECVACAPPEDFPYPRFKPPSPVSPAFHSALSCEASNRSPSPERPRTSPSHNLCTPVWAPTSTPRPPCSSGDPRGLSSSSRVFPSLSLVGSFSSFPASRCWWGSGTSPTLGP